MTACDCSNNNTERYYVGSELKFALTITCEGFEQDTDPWTATIKTQMGKSIVCSKTENSIVDGQGQWYLLVDTAQLGSGLCSIVVEIDVPDNDFEDGYRHEVYAEQLMTIKPV